MKGLSRTIIQCFRTAYGQAVQAKLGRIINRTKTLLDFGRFILFVITQRKQSPNPGCRIGEVKKLEIEDLNWENCSAFVNGKRQSKERFTPPRSVK